MKKILLSIIATVLVTSSAFAHNPREWRKLRQNINIFWASDLDRNGCFDQRVIANLMGTMAGKIRPECIVLTGDTHHGNGVKSVSDDDWRENYEEIYNHPKLNIDWWAVAGNHEYRDNSQALIDYAKVNPRWKMPAKYYTKVFKKGGATIRFVMLDTTPLIEKFRNSDKYPDARLQDYKAQLEWLESVLSSAKEDWVVVAGHHPIHADTKKVKAERTDMRNNVDKILRQHDNVAMYLCGHIHNFQHLRDKNSHIDYVITSSASLSRSVNITKRTVFCSPEPGFSVITASKKRLSVHMIDKNGNVLHTVTRSK